MGYAIKETSDGGFIVVGYTDIYSKEYTYMWLVRLDSNGKFLWNDVLVQLIPAIKPVKNIWQILKE